ncbi:unnamed protein product [Schistocephalus solidus]|uniref:Uncharacterized protein n=1 Tax=Schistocephalus solidus TaxID=70667 RepID=A0A183S9R3_SCHSO|nr:unnamed protein product [Schistocephalus solidus]
MSRNPGVCVLPSYHCYMFGSSRVKYSPSFSDVVASTAIKQAPLTVACAITTASADRLCFCGGQALTAPALVPIVLRCDSLLSNAPVDEVSVAATQSSKNSGLNRPIVPWGSLALTMLSIPDRNRQDNELVAQWVERWPSSQQVASSRLGCRSAWGWLWLSADG